MTSKDAAVFWVENVIKNDVNLLKSQAVELSWVSYYSIDVIFILLAVPAFIFWILFVILKNLIHNILTGFGSRSIKHSKKKKRN